MSDKKGILALCTIVTLAGLLAVTQVVNTTSPTNTAGFSLMGHITTIVTDENGNVKAYQQLDNTIVDTGVDCASDAIFGPDPFTTGCTDVDTIRIHSETDDITDSFTSIDGTISTSLASVTDTDSAVATNAATFTLFSVFSIITADTVGSTGLYDGANLFAGQTLTNPIPVVNGDEVTINWDLTVSG